MKNNKLISLLQTFSASDVYHFQKYLKSPFFNEQEDLVQLYKHLRKQDFFKEKTSKKDERLGIWNNLFAKKKYDDRRLRRLFSDLLQLGLDYLAYQQYQKNPAANRVMLLRALSGTHLEKHFAGVVRQTKKELERNNLLDADYHYLTYMLERRQHEQLEHIAQKSTGFDFLEKADYHLDCYYLSKKLEHYSDTLGYKDLLSSTAEINLPPDFMQYVENSTMRDELSVKVWHLVVSMMLDKEEESHFFQLKEILENKVHHFQKNTQKTLFIHLMNYCMTTKAHQGRGEYWDVVLSLYKTALEEEIIIEKNILALNHYKNIIAIALHLKQFDWVEQFIQKYTLFLASSDRENAVNYNLANVYFHQGLFEKVVEQLSMVEYQTIEYALGSKLLLMQSYFELEEIQALDSLIDSFKVYLRRNRLISKEVKQRYLNFLRFAKKTASLAPYDKSGREKILLQIEKCKALVGKKWLLEKIG